MKVVVIHGFRIWDGGKATTGQLVPFIKGEGWDVDEDETTYGYWSIWKIVFFNGTARADVLYRIARAIEEADLIIGHSNGANFGMQALDALPSKFTESKVVVWISGALNRNTDIPAAVKGLLVLHTPYDVWVRLASYIPFNRWGRMGAWGYSGDDRRVTNKKDKAIKKHSAWFTDRFVRRTWHCCRDYYLEHSAK